MLEVLVTGSILWALIGMGWEGRADLAREARQIWSRLGAYRVRLRVVLKADANPTARRNPKLLVGRLGG